MTRKVTYKNVDHNTVDICVEDENETHNIGSCHRARAHKWKLNPYFLVDAADMSRIRKLYDGPVEAGRELVKAWEYYRSYELKDTGEFFVGDLFK